MDSDIFTEVTGAELRGIDREIYLKESFKTLSGCINSMKIISPIHIDKEATPYKIFTHFYNEIICLLDEYNQFMDTKGDDCHHHLDTILFL